MLIWLVKLGNNWIWDKTAISSPYENSPFFFKIKWPEKLFHHFLHSTSYWFEDYLRSILHVEFSVLKPPDTTWAEGSKEKRVRRTEMGRMYQGVENSRVCSHIWCGKDKWILQESEDAVEVTWGLASCAHPWEGCKVGEEFPSGTGVPMPAVHCSWRNWVSMPGKPRWETQSL